MTVANQEARDASAPTAPHGDAPAEDVMIVSTNPDAVPAEAGAPPTDEGGGAAGVPATGSRGDLTSTAPAPEQSVPLLTSSTVSRGKYHQCGSGRRVKLYVLQGDAWADKGTGYCAGVYDEGDDEALIVVRKEDTCQSLGQVEDAPRRTEEGAEAPANQGALRYMVVVSEDLETADYLLRSKVVKEDVYQRQQDTLVVWTEPTGEDLALSFQELDGCNEMWDFLTEVQRHFVVNDEMLSDLFSAEQRDAHGGDTTLYSDEASDSLYANPFSLPEPEFANLETVLAELREACSHSAAMRSKVVEWLLKDEYIEKLIPRFQEAEELEALTSLHQLYGIMRTIVTINDNVIIEYLLQDPIFYGVIGMLEYNPEQPRMKACYRQDVTEEAQFHQVVPIDDASVLAKIHETYRLQYLKDVVLAGLIDDALLSMLNSLNFFYQTDIINYFANDDHVLEQLFGIFARSDEALTTKYEAVLFLQQLCAMAKQIQLPTRMTLFQSLMDCGLLYALEFALARTDTAIRNAAIEILMASIEYDAQSVRSHVLAQVDQRQPALVSQLIQLLLAEPDVGLKGQMAESLRLLFDVGGDSPGSVMLGANAHAPSGPDAERFLTWLYDAAIEPLFAPLGALPDFRTLPHGEPLAPMNLTDKSLYMNLCELLCFVVSQHSFRSQYFVLSSGVCLHVGSLLRARDKHMRLAALRFFRACLASNNQFTHRHLVKHDVLQLLLELLEREAPRDNLVSSACLGFFEQVRRANMKPLVRHLAEHHGEQVRRLSLDRVAGACFSALLLQWEKNAAPQTPAPAAPADADTSGRGGRLQDEMAEESYFASDDTDAANAGGEAEAATQPLVPYSGEEETARVPELRRRKLEEDEEEDVISRLAKQRKHSEDGDTKTPPTTNGTATPGKKLSLNLSNKSIQMAAGTDSSDEPRK